MEVSVILLMLTDMKLEVLDVSMVHMLWLKQYVPLLHVILAITHLKVMGIVLKDGPMLKVSFT